MIPAEALAMIPDFVPPRPMPSAVSGLGVLYMAIDERLDLDAEREKIRGQWEKTTAELERVERKLANADFVAKAPPPVVEKQRARRVELAERQKKLSDLLDTLGPSHDR
jgi:valyl-tRNA synthetase